MEPNHAKLASDRAVNGQDSLTVPAIIGGQDETLASTFEVVSPYSSTRVWKASDASAADAIRAVDAAKAALPVWSAMHPADRRRILLNAADLLDERRSEIAAIMRTEMGADFGASEGWITPHAAKVLRDYAASTTTVQGRFPFTEPEGQSAIVQKVPIGVVLSILPWNAPPFFSTRAIGAPLAAGCTVVVKASDVTPRCYYAVAKCYIDAGVPPGAVNLLSCRPQAAPEVALALIAQPAVRKIHFTGSTDVGRKVATVCAQNLKPCLMELGGKNAAVVLDDANLETAALQCVLGGFLNSGQVCMCIDRIIIQEKVVEQFHAVFSAILGQVFSAKNAPPVLSSLAAKERVERLVNEAKAKGASIMEGSWGAQNPSANVKDEFKQGVFLRPLVVKDVTPDMKIWSDEIFGVAVVLVTVQNEDEAIQLANDTQSGLSASVFTEDLRRGLRVAKQIETGQVHINRMTIQDEPSMPFGGVKASGWGRFNNKEGMEEFLTTKSITWMD